MIGDPVVIPCKFSRHFRLNSVGLRVWRSPMLPQHLFARFFKLAFLILGIFSWTALGQGSARNLATAWLHDNGWHEGYMRDSDRLVVVGEAAIKVPSSSPEAFIAARTQAFDDAMMQARAAAASFIAQEVRTAFARKTDQVQVIGNPELARALTEIASTNAFRFEESASKLIDTAARAAVGGLYAKQTFQSCDGQQCSVSVVVVMGARSIAALGNDQKSAKVGATPQQWFLEIPDAKLALTFGVRWCSDSDGLLRPIAFGQHAVREGVGREVSRDLARQSATALLSGFLGERVACQSLTNAWTHYQELTNDEPKVESVEGYESLVSSATKQDFGIEVLGTREVVDPESGAKVFIVAATTRRAISPTSQSNGTPVAGSAASLGGCPPIPPEMAQAARQVRVSGVGPTPAAAIEAALFDAIRTEGTMVEGNSTLNRRYQEAFESDRAQIVERVRSQVESESSVRSFSSGFVHSFATISMSPQEKGWTAELCVNLIRFDPRNPRFGLKPTIAVMPFICERGAIVRAEGRDLPCERVSRQPSDALQTALVKGGVYEVLAQRDLAFLDALRDDIAKRVEEGRVKVIEALKLGNESTPDFVLIGHVQQAQFIGASNDMGRIQTGDSATATLVAEIANVATGAVVWSETSSVRLGPRDFALIRAGKNLEDPAEGTLSPLSAAVQRASFRLGKSLEEFLVTQRAAAEGKAPQRAESDAALALPIRMLRVAKSQVTLDASHPFVRPGARFDINLLVPIDFPDGRKEVDRDRLAVIEVTEVSGTLAKAKVIEGTLDEADPVKCEVVVQSRGAGKPD